MAERWAEWRDAEMVGQRVLQWAVRWADRRAKHSVASSAVEMVATTVGSWAAP